MKVLEHNFGTFLLEPARHVDTRGFFEETWNSRCLEELGIFENYVQDNRSVSVDAGTVRGLHFQASPFAQAKLVRCGRGAIYDVAVDIRAGSSTFGRWVGFELSFENSRQLFIPKGFAHGFVTLLPDSEIIYKCSNYYSPDHDGVIRWDDPDIGIEWPLSVPPILSEKDTFPPKLSEISDAFDLRSWE